MAKDAFKTGQKIYRLTLVERYTDTKYSKWSYVCDCGKKGVVMEQHLLHGHIRSCGCFQKEKLSKMFKRHGKCHTSEYKIWSAMKDRCLNPNNTGYKNYGGRGIKVCKRWGKFENFIKDMGKRQHHRLTLDRIDNEGNYEPSNCRWATYKVQANNRRDTCINMFEIDGVTYNLKQLSKKYNIGYHTLYNRLFIHHWNIKKALHRETIKKWNINGIWHTIPEMSDKYNISKSLLRGRLCTMGWSVEKAVSVPIQKNNGWQKNGK